MAVLSMFQSADFYFSNGKKFFQKKEYLDAISYLKKAVELDQSEEHVLELALAYSQIGAYNESIILFINLWEKKRYLEYSLALAKDCRQHAFLHGNYSFPDNGWLIPNSHRLKPGNVPRLAQFWENINFELLEELSSSVNNRMILLNEEKYPSSELILIDTISRRNLARAYVAYDYYVKGNFDKSISTCMIIEPESEEYEMGLDIMARAAYENGDSELAESVALKLLEIDNQNTTPYDILLKIYISKDLIHDKGSFFDSLINKISLPDNSHALKYLAIVFSTNGLHEYANKAAEKLFRLNEMNSMGVSCYIGVLINSGELEKARKLCRKYSPIFPNDLEITFLNWYVDSSSVAHNEVYFSNRFSPKVTEELIRSYAEEFYSNCLRNNDDIYLTKKAYDLLDVIFAFQNPQPIIEALSLNNSNKEDTYQQYLINKLKNIDIRNTCKATIMFSLLVSERSLSKKITFPYDSSIISGYVRSFPFPKTAKGSLFKEVYAAVYTYLLLHGNEIISDELKGLSDKIYNIEENMKSYGALCSLLLYTYQKAKDKEVNLPQIVKIFGTNMKTFNKYLNFFRNIE